jgi:SWI/SNF chromatin-remodeling complex subunit SWI1
MAALNAANQARLAANTRAPPTSSGTNTATYPSGNPDLLNNMNNPANFQIPNNHGMTSVSNSIVNTSFLDPAMAQPNAAPNPAQATVHIRQRQQVFLNGLANVMAKRNTPLPPALTGLPTPNYDPTNSPWKLIEPSSEVGSFRLAGKDVNLFKLWGLVQHNGGGHAVCLPCSWCFVTFLLRIR